MFCWYPHGEVLPEHVDFVCATLRGICEQYGYAMWLVDGQHSIPLGYDSRRRYAELFKDLQGAVVIAAYRPPLPARTTSLLIMRAVQMKSGPDAAELRQAIFESEPEARQYLSEQRQRIGGPGPVPAGPTVGPTPRPSK